MLGLKYLILCTLSLLIFCVAESISAATPANPIDWKSSKVETLSYLTDTIMKRSPNEIIIIARQNVHNSDGSLKEIRTIELTVPNLIYPGFVRQNEKKVYLESLVKDDDDIDDTLLKMRREFQNIFDNVQCDTRGAVQKLSENGDVQLEIYSNKDEIFYQDEEGTGYYDRENIIRTDKDKLAEEFKTRFHDKTNDTLISVLVWDEDGNFVSNKSRVEPKLLTYVDEASDDVDEEMLDTAMKALSNSVLARPDNVAKELSATMSNIHPEYVWLVTKWQAENAENANHDVYIKVTYDNVKLGDDIFEYTLYGIKK